MTYTKDEESTLVRAAPHSVGLFIFMASDPRLTLSNQKRYTAVAKSTTKPFIRLSDQLVEKLGTSRMSEVIAKIGNTGEPREKIINDWCNSL